MAQYVNLIARCLVWACLIAPSRLIAAGAIARDPTVPPPAINAPAVSTSNSAAPVQFISIRGNRRTAIVRGVTVNVGDLISEGRITGISDNGVWVKSENGNSELKLFPDVNKHRLTSNPTSATRGTQR